MEFLVYLFSWVFEINLILDNNMQELINLDDEKPIKMTMTEMIFNSKSPYDNPYQGTDSRVLFVCSAGEFTSVCLSN